MVQKVHRCSKKEINIVISEKFKNSKISFLRFSTVKATHMCFVTYNNLGTSSANVLLYQISQPISEIKYGRKPLFRAKIRVILDFLECRLFSKYYVNNIKIVPTCKRQCIYKNPCSGNQIHAPEESDGMQ